jgi:hypothetical protein
MSTRPFNPLSDLALSPAHKDAARKQLDLLAEQTRHPELRDLAHDVLSGRMNVRAALFDPRATDILDEQVGQFSAWYRELPTEELTEHERRAEEFAKDVRREAAGPRMPRSRPRPDDEDDWEESRPILKKRQR